MRRMLPIIVVAVLVVDGVVYGLWTNRWRSPEALQEATARLGSIPTQVGDWHSRPGPELSERECTMAGFAGHGSRIYTNRQTGRTINILVACGPSGPISVHTPDVCYRGAGYEIMKAITKREETAPPAELWEARFAKPNPSSPQELRVLWTWNVDGAWQAPESPRVRFAGTPALYKLYVVQELSQDDQNADEACADFLRVILPVFNEHLFPKM